VSEEGYRELPYLLIRYVGKIIDSKI
jgi:hypothetical protein